MGKGGLVVETLHATSLPPHLFVVFVVPVLSGPLRLCAFARGPYPALVIADKQCYNIPTKRQQDY